LCCQSRSSKGALAQATGSLAQAKSFRLSEIENTEYFKFLIKLAHLAQARGLHSDEHSKLKGASYYHYRLGKSFPFGREAARLGEHSRSHLVSRMQSQKSMQKQYTDYFHTIKSTSNYQEHPTKPKQTHYL